MQASTMLGTLAAAGAAVGVVRVADHQFGPPRPETETRHDWLRGFNRRVFNPLVMRVAGGNPPFLGVVGHVGRSSARPYETPVWAFPTATGFVVALTYGRGVEWCKNLVAAGGGTLRSAGETVGVRDPTFLDRAQALTVLDGFPRAFLSRLPFDDFLRLERDPGTGSGPGPGPGR